MQDDHAAERETPLGVLALAFGLLVLVGAVLYPLVPSATDIDGEELLAESFDVRRLPLGFEITTAKRLADGRVILTLHDSDAPPPEPWVDPPGSPPPPPDPKPDKSRRHGRGHGYGAPTKVWVSLVEGEEGRSPREVTLIRYPRSQADAVHKAQFQELRFQDLTRIAYEGAPAPMESGKLRWAGFEPQFARIRHFAREEGKPTFHDTVRVNLMREGSPWIMYLRWDEHYRGDPADAQDALADLLPGGE